MCPYMGGIGGRGRIDLKLFSLAASANIINSTKIQLSSFIIRLYAKKKLKLAQCALERNCFLVPYRQCGW